MKIKPLDFVVFAVPLLIAVLSILFLFKGSGTVAVIKVNGKTVMSIDLAKTEDKTIDLMLEKNNVVQIENHKIGVVRADCADKICVHKGFINQKGDVIACVPSHLIIEIKGDAPADAVTGCINFFARAV